MELLSEAPSSLLRPGWPDSAESPFSQGHWSGTVEREAAADALTVTPALADGELATLDGGKPAQCVTLGPFGIKVLRIAGRRQPPGEERDL